MKLIDLSTPHERIATFYKIVCLISLSIILFVAFYGAYGYFIQEIEVVGLSLVTVQIPVKPVTMFYIAAFAGWYSGLQLSGPLLRKMTKFQISISKFLSIVIAVTALYEILFNFTFWSGTISAQALIGQLNPDLVIQPFPNDGHTPWSIVFATKAWTILTLIALYTFYFINKYERKIKSKDALD